MATYNRVFPTKEQERASKKQACGITGPSSAALRVRVLSVNFGKNGQMGRFELVVLGVAQDAGLPHLGCTQPCCASARVHGRREEPACIAVYDTETGGRVVIDATWALPEQLALLQACTGQDAHLPDAIVLTHAHIGHYTGLMFLGREGIAACGLPVHCSQAMAAFLGSNQPWSQLISDGHITLVPFEAGGFFEPLPEGLRMRAVPVPHRNEHADTMAFRIEADGSTALYCPDIDAWGDELHALLDGVDVALLDGTFCSPDELDGRAMDEIPHPLLFDSMALLADRAQKQRILFTHFNHTNPVFHDDAVVARIEAAGFECARKGLRVGLDGTRN